MSAATQAIEKLAEVFTQGFHKGFIKFFLKTYGYENFLKGMPMNARALLGILLAIGLGRLDLPLLAVLGFVAVCGTVAYSVAAPALVPSLVQPQQLPAANARIELVIASVLVVPNVDEHRLRRCSGLMKLSQKIM